MLAANLGAREYLDRVCREIQRLDASQIEAVADLIEQAYRDDRLVFVIAAPFAIFAFFGGELFVYPEAEVGLGIGEPVGVRTGNVFFVSGFVFPFRCLGVGAIFRSCNDFFRTLGLWFGLGSCRARKPLPLLSHPTISIASMAAGLT